MTIAAGIVFFDDEKGLQRCLSSIQSYVDLIIAIDGKFKYFEDDHDLSIDDSRRVVESFPNAVYYCYPNLTEIDKRNKYLEIAGTQRIDFLLVIDSDEYAVIDINEFSKDLAKIKEDKTSSLVGGKLVISNSSQAFDIRDHSPTRNRSIIRSFIVRVLVLFYAISSKV